MPTADCNSPSSEPPLRRILATEKVRYLMHGEPFSVRSGGPVQEALEGIRRGSGSYALVLRDQTLVGILTERDHLDKIIGRSVDLDRPVDEFMTPDPLTIEAEASVAEAFECIVDGGFRHLPVVENGKVVGLVSALDLVRFVAELHPTEVFNLPPTPGRIMAEAEGG